VQMAWEGGLTVIFAKRLKIAQRPLKRRPGTFLESNTRGKADYVTNTKGGTSRYDTLLEIKKGGALFALSSMADKGKRSAEKI